MRSLQCFLRSVLERRRAVVLKDLARFLVVPAVTRDKSKACFPDAFQSHPSNVTTAAIVYAVGAA